MLSIACHLLPDPDVQMQTFTCPVNHKVAATRSTYRPRRPRRSPLYQLLEDHFEEFLISYEERFPRQYDLRVLIRTQLNMYHKQGIDNGGIFPISGLAIEYPEIFKAKKFACRSLKGKGNRSGIRVIYAYFSEEDRIEFIEIYFKGNKANEDRERILKHHARQEND